MLTREQEALFHQWRPTALAWLEGRAFKRIPESEKADFRADGLVGLMDACRRYDPANPAAFSTYAYPRVVGSAMDGLRSRDWVPRSVRAMQARITKAESAIEQATGQPSTATATAEQIGITVLELAEWQAAITRGRLLNIDRRAQANESDPYSFVLQTIPDRSPTPDVEAFSNETTAELHSRIHHLPPRERHVIESYYWDGLTLREIGETLGVTESRVSQLHTKALQRLRPAMQRLAA